MIEWLLVEDQAMNILKKIKTICTQLHNISRECVSTTM